jgi:hypothetical protein
MKKQQAFNLAYLGVTAQGKPSIGRFNGAECCVFNSPDGCHCNIGWLDDMPSETMSVHDISARLHLDELFVSALQNAHDSASRESKGAKSPDKLFIKLYKTRMAELAQSHNLRVPLA